MVSVAQIQTIYDCHKKGMPKTEIAKKVCISPNSVGQYVRAINCYENNEPIPENKFYSKKTFLKWIAMNEGNAVKQEKPEHDLAAAYKFLRDECIEVEMNDMNHLIITVEVSKWESLF